MVLVQIDKRGNVRLPEEARAALNLEDEAQLRLDVVDGAIVLRPANQAENVDKDRSAYSPERLERIRRAVSDAEAGRVYHLGEGDLLELVGRKERAEREGRTYRPTDEELRALEAAHRTATE